MVTMKDLGSLCDFSSGSSFQTESCSHCPSMTNERFGSDSQPSTVSCLVSASSEAASKSDSEHGTESHGGCSTVGGGIISQNAHDLQGESVCKCCFDFGCSFLRSSVRCGAKVLSVDLRLSSLKFLMVLWEIESAGCLKDVSLATLSRSAQMCLAAVLITWIAKDSSWSVDSNFSCQMCMMAAGPSWQ